jgi:hypothetical protein
MLEHIAAISVCYGGHFESKMTAKIQKYLWKVSSNSEHFKLFVLFCGFHGNGGHFENSDSSLHIYS